MFASPDSPSPAFVWLDVFEFDMHFCAGLSFAHVRKTQLFDELHDNQKGAVMWATI
jgi:hypothetical protein